MDCISKNKSGKKDLIHVGVFVYLTTFLRILIHALSINSNLATSNGQFYLCISVVDLMPRPSVCGRAGTPDL